MDQLVLIDHPLPHVVRLTLNRPEKRNALNFELIDQLDHRIETLSKTSATRVIILSGEGKTFCAGLDLQETADAEEAHRCALALTHLLKSITETDIIVIGAAHGAALGGGAGILAACDLSLIEEGTKLGLPETHRGLVAALIMPYICRRISLGHVKELVFTGKFISPEKAAAIGLVNGVATTGELHKEALKLAQQVLEGGPEATRLTKRLLRKLGAAVSDQELEATLQIHLEARQSRDAAEGAAAFNANRKPVWG
jgi:methylglutaconyl-CoA hydratase